jgi:hypothetical protein
MTSNNEEEKNEGFILNLSNTFKDILEQKDNKIDEIKKVIIQERFEILRIYMFIYSLNRAMGDIDEFLTQDDIKEKIEDIEREFKNFLVSILLNDIDLIIE